MTYYEEYKKGYLVLPHALMDHFSQLFPSSEDFLVWLYLHEDSDIAPSEIAKKIGKQLSEVNQSITNLQNFGALKMTLVEMDGDVETIFDVSPAFNNLDALIEKNEKHSDSSKNSKEEQQLKNLVATLKEN